MKKYRTGLVVGKFCPLTRGHQYLIDTAISQCDQLIIISYTSQNFENCEPTERERWLKRLYPAAQVHVFKEDEWVPQDDAPERIHRQFCAQFLLQEHETTVQAVFTSETYGDGFAESLSQYFTACLKTPIKVDHVCVDAARTTVLISGTAIRSMPWAVGETAWDELISPIVRASFVPRIAILGGESSGKTTLCARLSNQFSMRWVPEFGRTFTEQIGGTQNLVYEDLEYIGRTQIEHEIEVAKHVRLGDLLLCDTTPLTTMFYSVVMFNRSSSKLQSYAERKYARVYLCDINIPHENDGTRFDEAFRERAHDWYVRELCVRGVDYKLLTGTVDERVQQVLQDLRNQGFMK